ncbi:hypothetical protein HOLleu_16692 [Holothuria leucospilota]|uniref:Uncharacterized protein n=1 Tax=Holothuria leucospilota TaxID=206669 RepID=A0A9Q1C6E9_HOLLE|nr:hypothetical protein HOLleu_16692 [Holothuria leucospilota]
MTGHKHKCQTNYTHRATGNKRVCVTTELGLQQLPPQPTPKHLPTTTYHPNKFRPHAQRKHHARRQLYTPRQHNARRQHYARRQYYAPKATPRPKATLRPKATALKKHRGKYRCTLPKGAPEAVVAKENQQLRDFLAISFIIQNL